jgi:hypothetical protein
MINVYLDELGTTTRFLGFVMRLNEVCKEVGGLFERP